jgi:hypothetical protein
MCWRLLKVKTWTWTWELGTFCKCDSGDFFFGDAAVSILAFSPCWNGSEPQVAFQKQSVPPFFRVSVHHVWISKWAGSFVSRLCCHQRRRLTQLPWQICSRHILPDYHPLFWIFPIVFIWTRREKQSPNACATLEPESIYRQKLRITRGQVPMGFPSVMNGADLVWMAVLSHCFFSPGYAEHAP